jgi:hypothetical protein
MNTVSEFTLLFGVAALVLLVTFKTFHFRKATQRPTFRKWLTFSRVEIEGTADTTKRKLKRRQNYYSLALLRCIVLFLLLFWLSQNA